LLIFEEKEYNFSKFQLEKRLNISKPTLYKKLRVLKSLDLIREYPKIGSRKRTEVRLTKMGEDIAKVLYKLKQLTIDLKIYEKLGKSTK